MAPKISLLLLYIVVIISIGCSGGQGNGPITPESENPQTQDSVNSSIDASTGRTFWGAWRITIDSNTRKISTDQVRNLEAHFNVTNTLFPPQCADCLKLQVQELDPAAHYIKVAATVKNPTQLSGYDVRGILITEADGFTLLNVDAYTNLWDDGGSALINPFRAFATDQGNRKFAAGATHTRVYEIEYGNFSDLLNLTMVVDASWPGNCKEPYDIDGFQQVAALPADGGSVDVSLDVYDWQYDAQGVFIDATSIGGGLVQLEYVSLFKWQGVINVTQQNNPGVHKLRVYSGSAGTNQKLYDFIDFTVSPCGPDDNQTWQDAVILPLGLGTGEQLMCEYDDVDWYKFSFSKHASGEIRLTILNDAGPLVMWLYADPEGSSLAVTPVEFGADGIIDVTPLELAPSTYYMKIGLSGPGDVGTRYNLFNGLSDSDCFPDGNDGFTQAQNIDTGGSSGTQYVCLSDKSDWFSFYYDNTPSMQINLTVLNGTGAADLTLYSEAQAPTPDGEYISWKQANPYASINLDSLGLSAGTYFLRVRHIGSDQGIREYTVENSPDLSGWLYTWDTKQTNESDVFVNVDHQGSILIAGLFHGTVDFDPGEGVQEFYSPHDTIFIVKYDASGQFVWGRSFAKDSEILVLWDFSLDADGNSLLSGKFDGTIDFDPGPGVRNLTAINEDFYFVSLNSNGDFVGAGNIDTYGYCRSQVNQNGEVYIAGQFSDLMDFDPGAGEYKVAPIGDAPTFILKLDSQFNLAWFRQWGGPNTGGLVEALATDLAGDLYMVGTTLPNYDMDPGPGEYLAPEGNMFLTKLDIGGDFAWSRTFGGDGFNYPRAVAVSAVGGVYVGGEFMDDVLDLDPTAGEDLHYVTAWADADMFLAKYNLAGDFQWGRTWAGTGGDTVQGLGVNSLDQVCIAGVSGSYDLDLDPGPGEDIRPQSFRPSGALILLSPGGSYLWGGMMDPYDLYSLCFNEHVAFSGIYSLVYTGWFEGDADLDPGLGVDMHTASDMQIFFGKLTP